MSCKSPAEATYPRCESKVDQQGLACRCGFGVSRHVTQSVIHVDDRHIIHPLGKHLANYDCSTAEVRLPWLTEFLLKSLQYLLPLTAYAFCRHHSCLLEKVFQRSGAWHSLQTKHVQQWCSLFLLTTRSSRWVQLTSACSLIYLRTCLADICLCHGLLQCAVYNLAKPKRPRILHVDPKYSPNATIQALTFRYSPAMPSTAASITCLPCVIYTFSELVHPAAVRMATCWSWQLVSPKMLF